MISTKFINQLMDTFGVKQKDLAEEWTRLSDGGKQQSGVSRMLKRKYMDSSSLVKALSNLTGVPAQDILYEVVHYDKDILYTSLNEPEAEYLSPNSIDVQVSDLHQIASGLLGGFNSVKFPKTWVKPGAHRLTSYFDEGMIPTIYPGDLLVMTQVEIGQWKDVSPDKVYQIVNNEDRAITRRIMSIDKETMFVGSDNDNKAQYPDYVMPLSSVVQIWELDFRVTWKFPTSNDLKYINHTLHKLSEEMRRIKSLVPK
jgi:hypothetical protein